MRCGCFLFPSTPIIPRELSWDCNDGRYRAGAYRGALHWEGSLENVVTHARSRLPDETGLQSVVLSGIGKETALDLARRGARVILACRDMDKTNQACREIISKTGNKEVIGHHIDLSSLQSVRDFAHVILTTESRLDVLVNNAGAAGLSRKRTQDGLQIEMQINHFGPFLLVNLLLGLLKRSAPSRVIMVTSILHTRSKLDVTSLDADDWFDDENLYSTSKLANILVANELARKLRGSGVTANSTHPGFVATEVFRRLRDFRKTLLDIVIKFYAKTPEEGAQTNIYLAASEEVEGISGKYFVDCKETKTSRRAQNVALAKKLWEKSELLVKMSRDEIHY
uniref:Retinol dehydrogenase 13 n=1 Tax=Timema genevievae TaxID=629358 RepID=A0A7R9JWQ8_TIMGE|nr:unnamed protein product [Timema genevievae]